MLFVVRLPVALVGIFPPLGVAARVLTVSSASFPLTSGFVVVVVVRGLVLRIRGLFVRLLSLLGLLSLLRCFRFFSLLCARLVTLGLLCLKEVNRPVQIVKRGETKVRIKRQEDVERCIR